MAKDRRQNQRVRIKKSCNLLFKSEHLGCTVVMFTSRDHATGRSETLTELMFLGFFSDLFNLFLLCVEDYFNFAV